MKLTIPIELDVNLTPEEIIRYVKQWIYPILKQYQLKGSDYCNSTAIVRDNKLYWRYQETYGSTPIPIDSFCGTFESELQYKEIIINDPVLFDMCKGAVELINNFNNM